MKHSDQDRLLNEIITGEELADFRQTSLQHALVALRQRRRRQHLVRLGALAVVPLLAALAILGNRPLGPASPKTSAANASPAPVASAQPQIGAVKFINDDELLALFPDRPVALIGKPGRQQLVFLDQPAKRSARQF